MQSKINHVYSVIDIGTNTCLLLIASIKGKKLRTLFEAQETPRIGKNLYRTGKISDEAFQKSSDIIKNYISVSKEFNSEKIFAYGTSALREAKNSREFVEFIESETGLKIKIITGKNEAKYSYEGATFDFKENKDYAVLDIGGGSTEICFLRHGQVETASLKIGSVRIYEKFFKENFSYENLDIARKFIKQKLNLLNFKLHRKKLIGVAGTMTTLSAIKNELKEFKEEVINKDKLSLQNVESIFEKLISMSEVERLSLGRFMEGRSDIIICGTQILIEFMTHFNFDNVIVSTKGLRYGLMQNLQDFI